ncbi:MAG: cell division protein ZapA [Nannocystaceae bacterium]
MRRAVQVEIAGQCLSIVSDQPEDYVRQLADYVDGHLRELGASKRSHAPQRSALLVAIQIADDLFREKDLARRFRARVEARLKHLEAALDSHETRIDEG